MSIIGSVLADQILALILLVTFADMLCDVVTGVLAAIRTHTFDAAHLTDFLLSHVAVAVLPITVIALFASIVSAAIAETGIHNDVVNGLSAAAWAAAWAGLAAYTGKTLASLGVNIPAAVTGAPG